MKVFHSGMSSLNDEECGYYKTINIMTTFFNQKKKLSKPLKMLRKQRKGKK